MDTLLQFVVIGGVCAGLGALFVKRDHRSGAIGGFIVGLMLSTVIYFWQQSTIENAALQKRMDKAAAELRESDARYIRNQQEAQKYEKNLDDVFNGKMPKEDDR